MKAGPAWDNSATWEMATHCVRGLRQAKPFGFIRARDWAWAKS